MNVLVLTPDRVGSTLLSRLITVYMVAHKFDQPVINLYELTGGIARYYSDVFNQEILGKIHEKDPTILQPLREVVELLSSTDHYKVSKLAYYHVKNRQDPPADQQQLYRYLNKNFFIISAQRENLLEHALSWGIYTHSKRLNVFSHEDKINVFYDLYRNGITIDPEGMIKYLNQYREYLAWVDCHFTVSSYFKYERDLPRIEDYILGLPVFNNQPRQDWHSIFGIGFRDWNQCHYLASDLSGLGPQLAAPSQRLLEHTTRDLSQTALAPVQTDIPNSLSVLDQQFLSHHAKQYKSACGAIGELVDNKILVHGIPIKLQTMLEKRLIVKNFNQCVDIYNDWVQETGHGLAYTDEMISIGTQKEIKSWHQQNSLAE